MSNASERKNNVITFKPKEVKKEKWENVYGNVERLKIDDGWKVRFIVNDNYTVTHFLPDAFHTWRIK